MSHECARESASFHTERLLKSCCFFSSSSDFHVALGDKVRSDFQLPLLFYIFILRKKNFRLKG